MAAVRMDRTELPIEASIFHVMVEGKRLAHDCANILAAIFANVTLAEADGPEELCETLEGLVCGAARHRE